MKKRIEKVVEWKRGNGNSYFTKCEIYPRFYQNQKISILRTIRMIKAG